MQQKTIVREIHLKSCALQTDRVASNELYSNDFSRTIRLKKKKLTKVRSY